MPCRNCRRRKTDDKCRIRPRSTLHEAAGTPTSFVGILFPSRGFAVMRFSTRDINCTRAILGRHRRTKTWHMTCRNCTECNANNALPYSTDVHDVLRDTHIQLHSDETIKDGSGKLTVRGESGNRHGRREAGGRQGVTTLQHGSGMRSLLFKRPEQKAAMRVRPSLLPAFLRLPKMGRYEKGRKAPSKSNASTRATHSGKASANAATGRWAMTSVQNRAGQNCARESARGERNTSVVDSIDSRGERD